jgi:hypothetical protein
MASFNPRFMKSMRSSSVLLGLLLLFTVSDARSQSFSVGDNILGASIGIGGHYRAFTGTYSSQSPAIGLIYELGFTELGDGVLSFGGYLGYKSMTYRSRHSALWGPAFEYDYRWTYFIMGFRAGWHYNQWHGVPELDTYGGLMLSYNGLTWRDNTRYPEGYTASYRGGNGGLGLTGFVGARYFFTSQLGAQLELGYGISVLSLGVVYKF